LWLLVRCPVLQHNPLARGAPGAQCSAGVWPVRLRTRLGERGGGVTRLCPDLLLLEMRHWRWKRRFVPIPTAPDGRTVQDDGRAICFLPGRSPSAHSNDGTASAEVQLTVLTLSFLLQEC